MTCRDDVASHNREMRIFIGLEAGRARLGCLATGLKAGCGNHQYRGYRHAEDSARDRLATRYGLAGCADHAEPGYRSEHVQAGQHIQRISHSSECSCGNGDRA